MKDWRGEERHRPPPPPPLHPCFLSLWKQCHLSLSPLASSSSSTICCHLFSQIPFKQCRSMALRQCCATTWITLYRHIGSSYPSWSVSLDQLEESLGSAFLLLFHIICLAITAILPWAEGIITIFQFKDSRIHREGLVWLSDCFASCCEEGTDRTTYRSSYGTNA